MKIKVIIITHNEEKHLSRSIVSALKITDDIVVLDSFSSDATVSIAAHYGAEVLERKFISHSDQLNWLLNYYSDFDGWFFRLDADEFLSDDLVSSINSVNNISANVVAFQVRRVIHFLGKGLRFGGNSHRVIRMFKSGYAHFHQTLMDEHVIPSGKVLNLKGDLIDQDLKGIDYWIEKHLKYAALEARKFMHERKSEKPLLKGSARLSYLYKRFYYMFPIGVRPVLYFIYRYIFRLGFLSGFQGFVFCFLHAFWYRLIVDLKIRSLREENK